MKTAMKRILGFVLCFVLILSVVPATQAFATLGSGSCGTNATWSLSDDGTLTISGSGAMNNYGNDRPWSAHNYEIKALVVKSGITAIGDYAFANCANLKSVSIASSVTSIGKGAFMSTGLTSITIPSNVTSIGVSAFEYCTSLTSVTLPAKLTAVSSRCFFWCTALKSASIPVGVTSIGESAFEACKAMTSATIPNGVTSIAANAFKNCESLGSITLPAGVASIGASAFEGCRAMTSATLPNGLTSIGEAAFKDCAALGAIMLPVGLTSVSNNAFKGCVSATSLTIPAGVTSIGASAFQNCKALTSISIPAGVTSIGAYAFASCSSATSVSLPSGLTSIGEYAFAYTSALKSVTIPSGVTSIGNYAFYASGLTSVTIPASVTSLGANPFSTCSGLTEIKVAAENKNYSSADGVLFNKNKTTLLAYPAGKTAASYSVPGSVKNIGDHSFENNKSIKNVTIPSAVSYIGASAFNGCSALESAPLPASVTTIGACAFCDCSALKSISIPSGVTHVPEYAFYNCASLESATLSSNVTKIGDYAFRNCGKLSSIALPASLERIGVTAFAYCSSLKSIVIPTSVKAIGIYAFSGDTKLSAIAFQGSAPSIGDMAFNQVTATVQYPDDGTWTNSNRLQYGGNLTWTNYAQATILTQPTDVTAAPGTTAEFTVSAGGVNLSYEWQVKLTPNSAWDSITNDSFGGIYSATLTVPVASFRDGYQFRCIVKNNTGTVISNTVKLTVLDKPVITKQPVDVTAADGATATYSVTATGTGLSYEWQVKLTSDSKWDSITNSAFKGVKTNTLTVPVVAWRSGYQFRCVVTNASGSTASDSAYLLVSSVAAPSISKQPLNVTAESGTSAKFSVEATGSNLSYEWQVKLTSDSYWDSITNSAFKGINSATLTVPVVTWRNGYQFRCVVTNGAGTAISNVVTLTVAGFEKPVITKQPLDVTAAPNTTVTYSVTATGTGLSYEWQVKLTPGSDWDSITNSAFKGINTATLTVPVVAWRDGYQFRCVVTNSAGTVNSNAAKLTVGNPDKPVITKQPLDATAENGGKATYSVTATGAGLSYEWQVKLTPSSDWDSITNSAFTGINTATLTVPVVTWRNGYQFRCVVSNAAGVTYSDAAKLTVGSATKPVITKQPEDATAEDGTKATYTVMASGTGLNYEWQVKLTSTSNWDSITNSAFTGIDTPTLTVPVVAWRNGYQFRCVITNAAGTVYSDAAKLTVTSVAKPEITKQPLNVTAVAGAKVTYSVTATGTGLRYEWQVKLTPTSDWDSITNDSFSGVHSATLSVPVASFRDGYQFRCVITNAAGTVYSNPATLTVAP